MKIDHRQSYKDFGKQFTKDSELGGYWGSIELLKEMVSPFDLNLINNKKIMEVGVGSGRISKNLLKFKPESIVGIEPSEAINVAKKNINSEKLKLQNIKGQEIKFENEFDYVFSLGVIHHIPEYKEVLVKILHSMKPDGKFIIWVYGKEGNELYLLIFNNLRRLTILLPDFILRIFSKFLALFTYVYGFFCTIISLPLKKYFADYFNKLSFKHRSYVIFDQLNPAYAKYFTKAELIQDLENCGFKIEKISNRLNYSYTAVCKK